VLAFKTLKHKGQAWVVFEDVASATEAIKRMQDFPFYDKPMVSSSLKGVCELTCPLICLLYNFAAVSCCLWLRGQVYWVCESHAEKEDILALTLFLPFLRL